MIKKTGVMMVVIVSVLLGNLIFSFGQVDDNEFIRIGLSSPLKSKHQVTLKAEDGFAFGIWNNGFEEIVTINSDVIIVRLDSYYDLSGREFSLADDENGEIGPYHIELEGIFRSYEDALEEVQNLRSKGFLAYPVFESGFRVWIGQFVSENMAEDTITKLEDLNKNLEIVTDSKKRIAFYNQNGEIDLMFDVNENIVVRGHSKKGQPLIIGVEDKNYRDYVGFNITSNQLIVINYIDLDHYLYGVVPREMSPNWPIESLKAQAVAARNYAIMNKNKHNTLGYDLCDTQDCQVYGGYDWENNNSNKAVDETAGKVIKFNDELIFTYYHSTSGGHTEDSEDVWSTEVPYLRGVVDEFSLDSPNASWQLVLDKEEIRSKLLSNGINVGDIIAIEPIGFSEYGRVTELMIKGTEETTILEKDKTRQIFGYSSLKSTWFRVNSDADVYVLSAENIEPNRIFLGGSAVLSEEGLENTSRSFNKRFSISDGNTSSTISISPNTYIFDGKGWGHGLGMSQWGAKKMAEIGYNYEEILEYYYTGANVE